MRNHIATAACYAIFPGSWPPRADRRNRVGTQYLYTLEEIAAYRRKCAEDDYPCHIRTNARYDEAVASPTQEPGK